MKASASVMRHLPKPLFKLLLMSLFYRGHGSRRQAVEAFRMHAPNYLSTGGAAALIRQIEQLRTSDTLAVSDALPKLGIPARIVWSDGDLFQKISYGEHFSKDLSAPLRRIMGGKHFTPEDHPEIIAEEIMKLPEEARL